MRNPLLRLAFIAQRQPLMDPKSVLFVDNDQPETIKSHILLEQRVGANEHLNAAVRKALQQLATGPALDLAR